MTVRRAIPERTDKRRGKLHQIFEPSFDWKECYTRAFTEQKLNYIHLNPCRGEWNLAVSPQEYEHSSARFYILGTSSVYPVKRHGELQDEDLSRVELRCADSRGGDSAKT